MELLYGATIGWILNEIFNFIKKDVIRRRKQRILNKSLQKVLVPTDGFLALDHAIPFYDKKNNITLRDSGKSLFIAIPSDYKSELAAYNFEIRDETIFDNTQNLDSLVDDILPETSKYIQPSIHEAAQEFLTDLRNGYMRFNGLMYGVQKIRPERLTIDENSGLNILFYKTDYYTYRVFGKIYKKIQEDNQQLKIEKLQDINLYFPFLSSFGLATFVIINRGNGDEILLGRRSQAVVVDKGKWHFSMNEAFSMKDKDEYGNPSFSACLFRGLEEELGISEIFKKYVKQYEFLDLDMDVDRFEIGLTSFVRLELNNVFTYGAFMDLYSIAQDGKLETSSITTIPIKKIDSFISTNHNDISAGCRGALKELNARYKAGYLREE